MAGKNMGSNFDQQEIISTPEAKDMRMVPSYRGTPVDVTNLLARRGVGSKKLHLAPVGRIQSPSEYQQLKAEAVSASEVARALQLLQVDSTKAGASTTHQKLRLATDFAGLDDTEIAPPECQLAAGPEHLIVTVNAAWTIFDKSGRQLLRRNFADLFADLVDDANIFSPKVIYDSFRGGWVMAALARSLDCQGAWFLIAFSKTADPMKDWWIWTLDARFDGANRTGHLPGNLGLSVDASSLYLTANMFNAQDQFAYAKLRMLNKKELMTGGVLHGWDFWQLRNFDGTLAFNPRPALNLRAAGAQYMLNISNDGKGLTQWTITQQPRQAPILSRRFIPTVPFHMAPQANQPMTDHEIDTGDLSLGEVIFRHGQLWAAHTIAANWGEDANVAAIQWFQINPRAGLVAQQGIFGAPHYHYFCPALMIDGESNLILVFNRAGELDFPDIRYTGRCASDESNILQASALLQQSSAPGPQEWSACSGAANMPDDPAIWLIGQYASTDHNWASWIGSVNYQESDDEEKEPRGRGVADYEVRVPS
jgi:hypothetical protein